MTTALQTPPPADAPLPTLTPAERAAALAWIERDGASLRQVAAQLGLAADDLLDILTQPHVAAFIEAAENIIHIRERILARYDDIDARQSLVAIAKNPQADHTTRLRAAITILQGPPLRRAAPAASAVPEGSPPDRSANRSTNSRPTSAPVGPPQASNRPASATASSRTESAQVSSGAEARSLPTPRGDAPARLNRTPVAPSTCPDRAPAQREIHIALSSSPATSGRPP